ncbi:conidiation-specific protein [Phyllosticta citribraziliensis]|uniref:Conidiation-specific protein n=1 Tax=Phyllosticta citribraziliensis TaxID=989973 RepID=A0ABR1L3X9_9PEZI
MSDNPGNFANRPTEDVKQAAAKGGHIAHHPEDSAPTGRNLDGTFMKGSHAAKDAGHIGGLHAHGELAS